MGAGRAPQHGPAEVHAAAAAPDRSRQDLAVRHRTAGTLESSGGVSGGASGRAGEDRGRGVRGSGMTAVKYGLVLTLLIGVAAARVAPGWSTARSLPEPLQEVGAAVLD